MTTAIKIENLSKKYIIGHQRDERYVTFRDVLTHKLRGMGQRIKHPLSPNPEEIKQEELWALRDINLEIRQGERIGIIGRNGAGKSTLLKVLSRITEPTLGRYTLNGRVASLLEVGTGFHPELSGRENIYFNGAILGMSKVEITRKFDEIVAFAETEKFLDTPVKRYSSGMYVRLAFAVAAHLETDILIVDEVLAVGDAQFQKKCLGKMKDVSNQNGRTILLVSHQMGVIAQLCNKAILLENGRIANAGPTDQVIDDYINDSLSNGKKRFVALENCDKEMFVAEAQALNKKGDITSDFSHQEKIVISIFIKINKWISDLNVGFFVTDTRGRRVFTTENREWGDKNPTEQELHLSVTIPSDFLVPGHYLFTFFISVPKVRFIDWIDDAIAVTVVDVGSKFLMYEGGDYGCVFANCKWTVENC